jgi:hypothetical protein
MAPEYFYREAVPPPEVLQPIAPPLAPQAPFGAPEAAAAPPG